MDNDEKARKAQARVIDVFTRRPEAALSTTAGTARLGKGLACTFQQGEHTTNMDMADAVGGDDSGPTPGFYGRAAIAGCVAIGIKMAAVRDGLKLSGVEVSIEQDFDDRGVMGIGGVPAAPIETRIMIRIDSDESSDALAGLVDRALAGDPWFLAFRDAQRVTTETVVSLGA